MQHVRDLLEREIETLATRTNTVISANTAAASNWDFRFQTFGEEKLSEMLDAAKDFIRDMAIGATPRWFSLLGRSGTGKTHLARGITRFFKAEMAIYIEPGTGAHLSRRGGFIGWRKVVDHCAMATMELSTPYATIGLLPWMISVRREQATFLFPSSIKSSMHAWVNGP